MMNRYMRCFLFTILLSLFFFTFIQPVVAENNNIVVEFFYSSEYCDSCEEKKPIINDIEAYYDDNITVERLLVDTDTFIENFKKMEDYGLIYPSVVLWGRNSRDV